ncbi:MAG: hypothetical protein HY833_01850 [Candidatus Aenigmarchaeota archaeon]|nr:hypothetical protein [Candidatus Aenigmarchaeota archaeon]
MRLVFGVVYILIAVVFALDLYLDVSSMGVSVLLSLYLISKGAISAVMKNSVVSALDSVCGLYFLLMSFDAFTVNLVTVIFLLYLAQKGATNVFRGIY